MLKRIILLSMICTACIFVSTGVTVNGELTENIGIMTDNQPVSQYASTGFYNGVMMIPAKELAQSIGGTFYYDALSMKGTIIKDEYELVFYLDGNIAEKNGKYINSTAPMKIINNRFMVPVEFTCWELGMECYMSYKKDLLMIFNSSAGKLRYKVMYGDSLWKISNIFGTSIDILKKTNGIKGDIIYTGQTLIIRDFFSEGTKIPAHTTNGATIRSGHGFSYSVVNYLVAWTDIDVTGKSGNWYKVETPKGNGYIYYTVIGIKQDINYSYKKSTFFGDEIQVDTSSNYVTYKNYTVVSGDTMWGIAQSHGIMYYELAAVNNMSVSGTIYIGQTLIIPVHHIAEKSKTEPWSGEILDWAREGQYVYPIGAEGKLIDLQSGKSFMVIRTIGSSHADTETPTQEDTKTMKEIFGGDWNWNRRPFILEAAGRRYAVSVSGMPHGGVDGQEFLSYVNNRSDNWGYGPNYDKISGNGMDGHFDLYFLNSRRHKDNGIDASHQYNVLISGGLN